MPSTALGECPDDDVLGALAGGELAPASREALAIHAASCAACHSMVVALADAAWTQVSAGDARDRPGHDEFALPPGAVVGRYTIERRVGAGGMGVVYAATDRELERRVALKFVRHGAGDPAARARLVREARTLAKLSHPHIVTLFDAGEHHDHAFVVMEYVDGGSVLTWARQRGRTTDEIIDAALAVGRALAAAHAAGIVHRDVKPDNVLIGGDGGVRVTDFGLARAEFDGAVVDDDAGGPRSLASTPLTRTGAILGTPAYMAPEALRGVGSAQTDQWSYCAMVYELLAGTRPFPDDAGRRAVAIAEGQLQPPAPGRALPSRVRAVLATGLREDPSARWGDMRSLLDALGRARARRRGLAVGIAVAGATVAVVAAATGAMAWRARGPDASRSEASPRRLVGWRDERPGCACPLSACDGHCVSECDAAAFVVGDPLPGISLPNRQEALHGASSGGDVVLYLAGAGCALDRLFVARALDGTFRETDLTDQLDRAQVDLFEGCCTLTRDGQGIVMTTPARDAFVEVRLDGEHLHPAAPLLRLALPTDANVGLPVLSADGRTLYFYLHHAGGQPGYPGPLDGMYQADRDDVTVPFHDWARIPGGAHGYDYVTGVSSDGLSLFLAEEYSTRVLVRASTTDDFAGPRDNLLPIQLDGWRAVPVDGCRRIYTTISRGGCHNEDITVLEGGP
ncbi:MAG: serine/threonine protein kinase [Myxococcales bacterium]|nr:serine/threonine protein kinase [Myxococcales bacterium]MBK7191347.1 serine/threonine protein kinase [Myxococcales bacterium]